MLPLVVALLAGAVSYDECPLADCTVLLGLSGSKEGLAAFFAELAAEPCIDLLSNSTDCKSEECQLISDSDDPHYMTYSSSASQKNAQSDSFVNAAVHRDTAQREVPAEGAAASAAEPAPLTASELAETSAVTGMLVGAGVMGLTALAVVVLGVRSAVVGGHKRMA